MIEAGRQIEIAIDDARLAYKQSLDVTFVKLDELIKDKINTLTTWIDLLEAGAVRNLNDLEHDVQQWIRSLGLAWRPELTRVSPRYIAAANKIEQRVSFHGRFGYVKEPTLKLEGKTYELKGATNRRLDFLVSVENPSPHKRACLQGKLKVPYTYSKN